MNGTQRITIPLGFKLVLVLIFLLLCSGSTLVWFSTQLFIRDSLATIQQLNADAAAGIAARTQDLIFGLAEKIRWSALQTVRTQKDGRQEAGASTEIASFWNSKDLLGLILARVSETKAEIAARQLSPEVPSGLESDSQTSALLSGVGPWNLTSLEKGELQVESYRLPDDSPAILFIVPVAKELDPSGPSPTSSYLTALALIRPDRFAAVLGEQSIVRAFVTDRKGRLLAMNDTGLGQVGDSLTHLASVELMLQGKSTNAQTRYTAPADGKAWLSAYHTVGSGGLGIIAEVPEDKTFEVAKRVQYRAMLIALVILCIFIFFGFIFSSALTKRLSTLVEATRQISAGNFAVRLRARGRDEIAWLGSAFDEMAAGLEERDRVKNVFNKFHSKEVAEKLLSGEVKLGGERRNAFIFFSDIRSFTTISEAMKPEEVVEMLNEYMTAMVRIIRRHGGIVDKYVGDAIMALWGVPEPLEGDAVRAVRACLSMRQELAQLNELRQLRGQPPLRIGMGLNFGPVIAGNIGSDEKMEYTVVGDSVNLASRVESMTKEMKTDFLITEGVREQLGGAFTLQGCGQVVVKGKTEATTLYQVLGEASAGEQTSGNKQAA